MSCKVYIDELPLDVTPSGSDYIVIDDGITTSRTTITNLLSLAGSGYTDEEAQDAVGNILTDSSTINFDYNDLSNTITASFINSAGYITGISGLQHDLLAGLTDDDHTQYALLVGRSGGQTLIGGTAAGDDLLLRSTSNATKGNIYFGADNTSTYDEVNQRLGLRVAAPTQTLDQYGNINLRSPTVPTACTAALAGAGAGNLSAGAYTYEVTFVTSLGESRAGAPSAAVTVVTPGANGQVSLTSIPLGPTTPYNTTARKLYRVKQTDFGAPKYYLLATLSDNTTTTYTDNTADTSLGAQLVYGEHTSGGVIYFDGVQILSVVGTSGPYNPTLSYDTYVGHNTGNFTGVGGGNIGIGSETLRAVTTGGSNIGIANTGLGFLTDGSQNVAIGSGSLLNLVHGNRNVAIGTNAGLSYTADDGVFVGNFAGYGNIGSSNVFVGSFAGLDGGGGGTGSATVAVGYLTLAFGSGGAPSSATAIGFGSGASAGTAATGFTGVGRNSGGSLTSGTYNTHIGYAAGYSDGTTATSANLDNVTTLGYNAQVTQSNSLILGGLSAHGFGVRVGINTTAPSAKLHVIETTEQLRLGYDASNYLSATINSTGSVTLNLTGTSPEFTFSDNVNISAALLVNPGSDVNIITIKQSNDADTASMLAFRNASGTAYVDFLPSGLYLNDGYNLVSGSSTGTNIGGSGNKLSFFDVATPIAKPSGDIATALSDLGLVTSPTVPIPAFGSVLFYSSITPIADGTYTLSGTLGGSITFASGVVTAFTSAA